MPIHQNHKCTRAHKRGFHCLAAADAYSEAASSPPGADGGLVGTAAGGVGLLTLSMGCPSHAEGTVELAKSMPPPPLSSGGGGCVGNESLLCVS